MADKDQTFTFDTVAVLVATITQNGGSLGAKEFKQMSALDGTRGEHGFNHMFRKVKARAKELNEQAKDGGESTPVKKTKGAGGAAKKGSEKKAEGTGGKKRARKPKKDEDAKDGDGEEESPTKKVKPEPEEDGEEDEPAQPNYEFEF